MFNLWSELSYLLRLVFTLAMLNIANSNEFSQNNTNH